MQYLIEEKEFQSRIKESHKDGVKEGKNYVHQIIENLLMGQRELKIYGFHPDSNNNFILYGLYHKEVKDHIYAKLVKELDRAKGVGIPFGGKE